MALDGIVVSSIVEQLNKEIIGCKIDKIYQPEKDEVILTIRKKGVKNKLFISANATNNRICLVKDNKENPMTAPMFCMILRKYISGGIVLKVEQVGFDRIISITISSYNDFGDLSEKTLIIELMSKHSNIILLDDNNIILDSIKRIGLDKSFVRQVLPKIDYSYPPNNKVNPLTIDEEEFKKLLQKNKEENIGSFISKNFNGISYAINKEICFLSQISTSVICSDVIANDIVGKIYNQFIEIMKLIIKKDYSFNVYVIDDKLKDFSAINMESFKSDKIIHFDDISELLQYYYIKKDMQVRTSQKTVELRKIIVTNISRCSKKIKKQESTLKDVEDRDKYRLYGELILANLYNIKQGDKKLVAQNYYEEHSPTITIKLKENLTPNENSQYYFKKYNKCKRTFTAITMQLKESILELEHLESVKTSLTTCISEADVNDIREELASLGIVKKRTNKKKIKLKPSKPHLYESSTGFKIYVGKNNLQNDNLSLKFAQKTDMWFHTKGIPGSHVVVVTNGLELDEETLLEASLLAGYYSKAKESTGIPVDYTLIKNLKKPNGSKPGMVIYKTNNTINVTPIEGLIEKIKKIS